MFGNAIFYGLVSLSVTLTLSYLSKATSKGGTLNDNGQYLLRMHKLYYIVGILALVFAAIFLASPIIVDETDLFLYITVFVMLLFFGGLGLLSIYYYKRHYVLFDAVKIEVGSPFGIVRTIEWTAIEKAKFNPMTGMLTFKNKTGEKVRVHYHLIGFPSFVEQLEEKTPWTAKALRLPVQKSV